MERGRRLIRNVVESKYKGKGWGEEMVKFGSGTMELERIRPRRIPRHFFRHELELLGDLGGKKRKRKKPQGWREGGRQKATRLPLGPPSTTLGRSR